MTGLAVSRLALVATLAACSIPDSAADRGVPPVIEASILRQDAFLQLPGGHLSNPERETLERVVRLVALGRPEAVRATVTARASEAGVVRGALIGLGVDPARIESAGAGRAAPLTAQVSLSRYILHTRDCGTAIQPATNPGVDVVSSLDSVGRCVQANNLAAMLADPGDLVASSPLEQQPGALAGGAVRRARDQRDVSARSPGSAGGTPTSAPPGTPAAGGTPAPAGTGAVSPP